MAQTQVNGDLIVTGGIYGPTSIDYPSGGIVNADVSGSAAIAASKCQRDIVCSTFRPSTAISETRIVHVVKGLTGTLKHFTVTNWDACVGAATVDVDLQVNAVSVLTAAVELDAATGDSGLETGTIDTPALTQGDVVSVVITTHPAGTDGICQGLYAQVDLDEDYLA